MSLQGFYSATATNSKLDFCSLSSSFNLFSMEMSALLFIKKMFGDLSSREKLYVGFGA